MGDLAPRRAAADARAYGGCRRIPMSRDEYESFDGRVECWEASSGTANVLREPVGFQHEYISRRLVVLVHEIGRARGSAIASAGTVDLVQRGTDGRRELVLRADEAIYLDLHRDRPAGLYVEIDADPLPDVVFEVDFSTDVRRGRRGRAGKLDDYAAWGMPEVWVEVPDSARTAGSRRPGLTIFLHRGSGYVEAPSSRAFPGWTAAEIHRALNEIEDSPETLATLRRVGRSMAAAEVGRPAGGSTSEG